MTMRIYKSTDASAPTLQGIVGGALSGGNWADGSLVNLLKKVLVDGYGSKTGAGWTVAFSGTSEGAFKQGAGSCGFYINVLDDGSVTAGAREAQIKCFETMSALHTGTGQFPSTGQNSGALFIRKSDTADTVQRSWVMYADSRTFYLYVWTGNSTAYYSGSMFGDFYSYYSGDAYNCAVIARATSAAVDATTNETLDMIQNGSTSAQTGHYMARGYSQLGTSVQFSKQGQFFTTTGGSALVNGANATVPYPNPVDGKAWLSRAYICDHTTAPTDGIRGFLRGFWSPQVIGANLPLEYTINGSGGLSGRTFRVLGLRTGNNANGRYVMESSDTWD